MFHTTKILNADCHAQPRLTALLASGNNFMPLSWHMPVSKSPFRYAVAIRDENKTYALVHKLGEFSINFLDYSYMSAIDTAGTMHGGDKFENTGLTPKKADYAKSTLIEEAYMIYECKVVAVVNFGDHDIFIADVLCIHNKHMQNPSPTLFLGHGYYDTIGDRATRVERSKKLPKGE